MGIFFVHIFSLTLCNSYRRNILAFVWHWWDCGLWFSLCGLECTWRCYLSLPLKFENSKLQLAFGLIRFYCSVFGQHFSRASLSPRLFSLCSVRTGSLLWRLITAVFTLVFFPLLCPQSSLCLDSQQETTAFPDYRQIYTLAVLLISSDLMYTVVFGRLWGTFEFWKCLHFCEMNISFAPDVIWGVKHDSEETFLWLCIWRHAQDDESCRRIRASITGCLQWFATKAWLYPSSSQFDRSEL